MWPVEPGVKIVQSYGIADRTEPFRPRGIRISLKDHKGDFETRPSVRLIVPSKSDLGIMSKVILDRILPKLREKIRLVQWRNTDSVVDWFRRLGNKANTKFIQFDIDRYYPSITYGLLNTYQTVG